VKIQRVYTDNFRAPLDAFYSLQGNWPDARAYFDTSQVRSPYKHGFYQDNTLMGLGVIQTPVAPAIPTWALLLGSFTIGFMWAKSMAK
jgi:hypothetical protein